MAEMITNAKLRAMTGATLKQWRVRNGLSQTVAAEALGCSRTSIKNWENSPARELPKYVALACAALAYGLEPMQ